MSLREEQCKKVCRILDDVLSNRPTERDSLIVAVRKAFKALAEPHWIPVTERLPKDYDVVLMTVRRTDKTFNQIPYLRIGFCESKLWYPIPQASAPFEVSLSNYDGGDPVVTAWMPLPKPYQLDER